MSQTNWVCLVNVTLQHTISLGITGDRTIMGGAGIDTRVLEFGVGWIILDCGLLYTLFASLGSIYCSIGLHKTIHSLSNS